MDLEEVKEFVDNNMKGAIDLVVDGEVNDVELWFCRPNQAKIYIESIGGEDLGDMDTNGWSWDFHEHYEINGQRYCLSGDGYYQQYLVFSKD